MLFPICFAAIAFVAIARALWPEVEGVISFAVMMGLASVGALVSFLVGVCLAAILGALPIKKTWKRDEAKELVSLRNAVGNSGSFFIGSGSIGQQEYYFYYEKAEGGYKPGKLAANSDILICESEREGAELVRISECPARGWMSLFAMPTGVRYEFHIPSGSMRLGYRIE